jgi:chromatin remodeling complex protein RSC6
MANSKKPTTTKTETTATPAPVAAPAKSTKKEEKKVEEKKKAAPVAAPKEDVKVEVEEEKKGRRTVTKESVYADFVELITKITDEIKKRSPADAEAPAADATKKPKRKKDTGVPLKFLRSINKRLLTLQTDASKMMKLKTRSARDNTKSGLMKPVGISEALFKFLKEAGFEVEKSGQYARVEITRKIHSYVKDNNLRKESDKRVILPDSKLGALLKYNQATAKEEMTYFRLPQYLKSHFISDKTA